MRDTRGSGLEYTRDQIAAFTKIADLYINDKRCIYAELLRDADGRSIYLREWLASSGSGDSWNFCIVNSVDELRIELKKDADHGDLHPGLINKICEEIGDRV